MPIFRKLLILFMTVALGSQLAAVALMTMETRLLRADLTELVGSTLMETALEDLKQLVEEYALLLHADRHILELILQEQADEVTRLLSEDIPESSKEKEEHARLPLTHSILSRYKKRAGGQESGTFLIPVSLDETDFKIAPGVPESAVAKDVARLTRLAAALRYLMERHSHRLVWMFTGLQNGLMCGYPGGGGFPEDYDPRTRLWYVQARENRALTWNPPQIDASGMGFLQSVSMPVYRADGSFAGVTGLDISLFEDLPIEELDEPWVRHLQMVLAHLDTDRSGGELSLKVDIASHYQVSEEMDWKTPSRAEWLHSTDKAQYARMIDLLGKNTPGVVRMEHKGNDTIWAFAPLEHTPFTLVLTLPSDKVAMPANEIRSFISERMERLLEVSGISVLAAASFILLISSLVSRRVSRPLQALSRTAENIARGNLDDQVEVLKSKGEIAELTHSVAWMQEELKKYIRNLEDSTALRERIESELRIAGRIQMSFIPTRFPPFPEKPEMDIYAVIHPAKEVGGDFYDFFLENESRLFFAIGDVSGKGVPGALLMARTRSIMRGYAGLRRDPGAILESVNEELCRNNTNVMFVTIFCGYLDLTTGELSFANAGHHPPYILRTEEGGVECLKSKGALVLGGFPWVRYATTRVILRPGDAVFLYTDGVTEAENVGGERFSSNRLLQALSWDPHGTLAQAVEGIVETLQSFCGDRSPGDDVTMLMIRFNGQSRPHSAGGAP